jgi:hypothetical protein
MCFRLAWLFVRLVRLFFRLVFQASVVVFQACVDVFQARVDMLQARVDVFQTSVVVVRLEWMFFRLAWMFSTSSALYPSIYLKDPTTSSVSNRLKVEGTLRETFRVRDKYNHQDIPILAYSRYRYGDSTVFYRQVRVVVMLSL